MKTWNNNIKLTIKRLINFNIYVITCTNNEAFILMLANNSDKGLEANVNNALQ